MTTFPPSQPQPEQQPPTVSIPARLPIPGNAEWAVWALMELIFAIVWWVTDAVDAAGWLTASAAITFAYLISRGIAKASRVLEH